MQRWPYCKIVSFFLSFFFVPAFINFLNINQLYVQACGWPFLSYSFPLYQIPKSSAPPSPPPPPPLCVYNIIIVIIYPYNSYQDPNILLSAPKKQNYTRTTQRSFSNNPPPHKQRNQQKGDSGQRNCSHAEAEGSHWYESHYVGWDWYPSFSVFILHQDIIPSH